MKTALLSSLLIAVTLAAGSLSITRAQAPTPTFPPGSFFPGQVAPGMPGQPGPQQTAPDATPPPTSLPAGVQHVYAVQGDNSLIIVADSDGFATVRELVRNIAGDLDIIHTRIDAVDITPSEQKALGVKIDPSNPAPTPSEESALLDAYKHDKLSVSCYPLRVVTRENTSVDVMLEARRHRVKARLSFVPRVAKDGRLIVEFMEPVSAMAAAPSGDTLVLTMPGRSGDTARLLFITPTEGR